MSRWDDRGSLLIVTLWLIIALSAGAVALSSYLSTETRLMRYHIAKAQARAWAEGGLILALERIAEDAKPEQPLPGGTKTDYDWLGDEWAYFPDQPDPSTWVLRVPAQEPSRVSFSGYVAIRMADENRKLDINRITTPNYDKIFGQLLKNAPEVMGRIVDYVDPDTTQGTPGLEHSDVPPYTAKNAPMKRLAELRDISGVTTDTTLWETLRRQMTVAPVGTININTADVEILRALFDAVGKPGLGDRVVDYRWDPSDGGDGSNGNCFISLSPKIDVQSPPLNPQIEADLTAVMATDLGKLLSVQSDTFTVVVTAQIEHPSVRCRIEAVVQRGVSPVVGEPFITLQKQQPQQPSEAFKLLAWRQE